MNRYSIATGLIVGMLSASLQAQSVSALYLGSPAADGSADRTIEIQAVAKWVNVNHGETIRFVVGAANFTWKFDGLGARPFDLRLIAPSGILNREVTAYIAPPPGRRP